MTPLYHYAILVPTEGLSEVLSWAGEQEWDRLIAFRFWRFMLHLRSYATCAVGAGREIPEKGSTINADGNAPTVAA
eukprot:1738856-Amphidinium_carterae.2